jgi:hypothetical protein
MAPRFCAFLSFSELAGACADDEAVHHRQVREIASRADGEVLDDRRAFSGART